MQASDINFASAAEIIGNYLKKDGKSSSLFNLLQKINVNRLSGAVKTFVSIESRCSIVHYSPHIAYYQENLPDVILRGWGAKNVSCRESIPVNPLTAKLFDLNFHPLEVLFR